MITETIKARLNQRKNKISSTANKMATSLSLSTITDPNIIKEVIASEDTNTMLPEEQKDILSVIFDAIMEGYNISKTDSKTLWNKLCKLDKQNNYDNFELVYFKIKELEQLHAYKELKTKTYSFIFRIFLTMDINNIITPVGKGMNRLFEVVEQISSETDELLEDLNRITLGLHVDKYEQWQKRFVQQNNTNNAEFLRNRLIYFKTIDNGQKKIFQNSQLQEEYENIAKVNIGKSIQRLKKGWCY